MHKDGKTYLDYSINHNYHPEKTDCGTNYKYIDTTIWIKEEWLCNEVNCRFPITVIPEQIYHLKNDTLSTEIQKYLSNINKEKHLLGTYGSHYC